MRLAERQVWAVVADHSFALMRLMGDPDPKKSKAVFDAMMKMRKIVIKVLERAYEGKAA